MSELAMLGGPKAVQTPVEDMFTWPIIAQEDEDACLVVLRRAAMSNTDNPFIDPRPGLGRLLMARITDDEKRQILGLNAKRVFRL